MSEMLIPATDLLPGDVVILPFQRKIVEGVSVQRDSITDDDYGMLSSGRPPGVTVYWTNGSRSGYRLDAYLDVER